MLTRPVIPTIDDDLAELEEKVDRIANFVNAPRIITGPKIAAEAVAQENMAPASIGTEQIIAGAVTSLHIAAGSIGEAQLQAGSVGSAEIQAGAIGSSKIAAGAVGSIQILAGSVGNLQLSAGSVDSSIIAAGAVGSAQIATDAVTATQIAASAVGSSELAASAVTAGKIAANAITAGSIAAGSIAAGSFAAGAVTAGDMTVSTLSAISGNLGIITAGTVTGATIQSSSANPKTAHDSTGFWITDDSGSKVIKLNTADGLDLPGATVGWNHSPPPPSINYVRWLRPSDSAFMGGVFASDVGGETDLVLIAGPSGGGTSYKTAVIESTASISYANITASAGPAGIKILDDQGLSSFPQVTLAVGQNVKLDLTGIANTGTLSLYDSAQQSQFLQLFSGPAKSRLRRGQVSVNFSGSGSSSIATVTHGLGVIPAAGDIMLGMANSFGVTPFVVTGSVNSTSFQIQASYPSAQTLSGVLINWWVIG